MCFRRAKGEQDISFTPFATSPTSPSLIRPLFIHSAPYECVDIHLWSSPEARQMRSESMPGTMHVMETIHCNTLSGLLAERRQI